MILLCMKHGFDEAFKRFDNVDDKRKEKTMSGFALNLGEDGRVLSANYAEYAPTDAVLVENIPQGNLSDYRYQDGDFVYDPLPEPEPVTEEPTQLDRVEAQVTYTAMMTDTLLEV